MRSSLPAAWRDTDAEDTAPGMHAHHGAIASDDLELRDERGTAVPTTRLELVVTGPRSAVAFISFHTAAARVGARVGVRPRGAADTTPAA